MEFTFFGQPIPLRLPAVTSPDDQRLLQPCLLPGERLLWVGGPRRGIRLRWADLLLIPLSLIWGGIAIAWNAIVWTHGAPPGFALFGLPFLAIGLYLIFGRFVHDAMLRASLVYAVTDGRIIVLRTRFGRRLQSAEIGHLPTLQLDERGDGRGTVRFDSEPPYAAFWRGAGFGLWTPTIGKRLSFDDIESPRLVYDLVRREIDGRRRVG